RRNSQKMDTEPPTVFGAHLKKYVNFLALHLDQAILIATGTSTKNLYLMPLSDAEVKSFRYIESSSAAIPNTLSNS
ncbi:unnamed protein product, partial [Fusarium graminearum]